MSETFLEHLAQLPHSKEPWVRFCELGLPKESSENYQYIPLKALFSERFASPSLGSTFDVDHLIFKECLGSCLIFINGIFQKELSRLDNLPPSLLILPMSKAETKFKSFLEGRKEALLSEEKDPLALLNLSHSQDGVFLYVPPKVVVKAPLQILHIYNSKENALFSPRIHIFLAKESELNVYTNEEFLEDRGWINSALDITIEERAKFSLVSLFEKSTLFHTESIRAFQKKESSLNLISLGFGKKLFRQDFYISCSKNSSTSLQGSFLIKQKNEAHIYTTVDHKEEGAHSLQKFKGVLHDRSRLSFEGKIKVREGALKTSAYQINNNLLLSDLARVYSKPNLEILADDVKASHGATIGKLNRDDLFYLRTRGLSESLAKKVLIEGFYHEIMEQILFEEAKKRAKAAFL